MLTSQAHVVQKRKHGEAAESDVYAPKHMSGMNVANLIPESMELRFKEDNTYRQA